MTGLGTSFCSAWDLATRAHNLSTRRGICIEHDRWAVDGELASALLIPHKGYTASVATPKSFQLQCEWLPSQAREGRLNGGRDGRAEPKSCQRHVTGRKCRNRQMFRNPVAVRPSLRPGSVGLFLNISDATKEQGKEGEKGGRRRLLVQLSSISPAHHI